MNRRKQLCSLSHGDSSHLLVIVNDFHVVTMPSRHTKQIRHWSLIRMVAERLNQSLLKYLFLAAEIAEGADVSDV